MCIDSTCTFVPWQSERERNEINKFLKLARKRNSTGTLLSCQINQVIWYKWGKCLYNPKCPRLRASALPRTVHSTGMILLSRSVPGTAAQPLNMSEPESSLSRNNPPHISSGFGATLVVVGRWPVISQTIARWWRRWSWKMRKITASVPASQLADANEHSLLLRCIA